jgi:hypothetical protein
VRAQVDRDLTTVSCFDRLVGLTKNLGRHRAPRSPEPELPRPPPDRRRLARPSTDPPSPGACLASSLGHMEASRAARGWAQPRSSPPFEFPRPRRRCSAAAAHRRPPRPIHRYQSITGEPNRSSPSHVCLAVPHLAAGELAIAVGSKGSRGPDCKTFKSSRVLCV